ncbi:MULTISPECIES: IclR family transcriptional regulator [Amycolatopsis]|uniref:Helix-turn-helix domain-containing protein n=1 Tax=Amycolatopsis dendrobii TaxID=2760662 RepID=A0A7W3VX94_9PSEU|nr:MULTISPECIES: helix-turn-helix domain-containing protein [Amycolatopsis]MBB1154741.1 helix-turn-helix domain-containing protein [Amycolatopsis dendrobii]UKD56446.1 helix-turn-helix domain-containing protein [Amycolatopsis sp. FU40]
MTEAKQAAGSQTLSRGLTALEVLAEADAPLSIGELASRLGLHRSIAYRIVRTLEDHGLVVRGANGELELGARLAALARNVSRDLQSTALPELTVLANELGMTAFLATLDGEDSVVTLASVEPRQATAAVAQRPGSRHPITDGAPGRAILQQLRGEKTPYETSHDEVIPGLSSIAVPLAVPGQHPAALAVVYLTGPADISAIGARLARAAQVIRAELHP